MFARKLERELGEANRCIKRLELANRELAVLRGAMGCVVVSCEYLHHVKAHRHLAGEKCPAEALVREAKRISVEASR